MIKVMKDYCQYIGGPDDRVFNFGKDTKTDLKNFSYANKKVSCVPPMVSGIDMNAHVSHKATSIINDVYHGDEILFTVAGPPNRAVTVEKACLELEFYKHIKLDS